MIMTCPLSCRTSPKKKRGVAAGLILSFAFCPMGSLVGTPDPMERRIFCPLACCQVCKALIHCVQEAVSLESVPGRGQSLICDHALGAHLSNRGFSPQSKESCRSRTRLAWPGMRKRPSSVRPCSRMKSTHCSTSRGARRGPYFRS